jgi:hypothetical protein
VLQDRFKPEEGNVDANLLTRRDRVNGVRIARAEDGTVLELSLNGSLDPEIRAELAAACWAAVLSAMPGKEEPMEIVLEFFEDPGEAVRDWVAEGWEERGENGRTQLSGRFVWSKEKNELSLGGIPYYNLVPSLAGGWDLVSKLEEEEVP